MLSDSKDDLIKSISLNVDILKLSEELVNEIEKISEENKGKAMLKFIVIDQDENLKIELFSRNHKVNLSHEFIEYLDNNPDINYKIN